MTNQRRWRVGELAQAAGLTSRTLRHYHHIGLLEPSERSDAGYRLYTEEDVRRLYTIAALRHTGMGLADIQTALNGGSFDPREAVRRQLSRLERQMELHEQLKGRLQRILDALDQSREPSADELIETMEGIAMLEKHYTPEQLAALEARRQELGEEGLQRGQKAWADLIQAVEAERRSGTDPADPRVQDLARQWMDLVEQFTGGDAGIREALVNMWRTEGPEAVSRGAVSSELNDYVGRAIEASTTGH